MSATELDAEGIDLSFGGAAHLLKDADKVWQIIAHHHTRLDSSQH